MFSTDSNGVPSTDAIRSIEVVLRAQLDQIRIHAV
jgi:hypothetical protein